MIAKIAYWLCQVHPSVRM